MRVWTWIAVVVAAPWVAWALVRTFGLDRVWPATAVIAFTPYAAMTSPLPVALALVLRRWAVAAVAAAAMVLLAAAVLPRAFGEPAPVPRGATEVTVMSSNLLGGRADAREVMALVRRYDVDVLSLQELTPAAVGRLDAAGAREALPGRALEPLPGGAGSGIMARGAVTAIATAAGGRPAQPEARVDLPGAGAVWVKAVHPFPPVRPGQAERWRELLAALPDGDAGGPPRIIAGDLNATLDHRQLRALLDRGWTDAADAVGEGLVPTWPVGRRAGPVITIDHVLVGPGVGVRAVAIHDVRGSDHRAVVARLVVSR